MKSRKMKTVGCLLVLGICVLASCASHGGRTEPPLQVVSAVDLSRYAGLWYEIASYPNRFQEGCFGSTANYTVRDDGTVGVVNQCRIGAPDGPLSSVSGSAWVVDETTRAKLKVRFFWPFSGDYWIIGLGKDYEYAVVGHPARQYLWILGRTPRMDEGLYKRILEDLEKQAYDVTRLVRTPQSGGLP